MGSGKGLFLRTAAAARPEVDFLGIEVAQKYAQFAAAALAKAGLQNALVAGGDALRIFYELIPDDSLAAIHVYFPDPWWKKRHKKRRVMRESFVRDAERTLRPGGSLHFWTDVEEYFQASLELWPRTRRCWVRCRCPRRPPSTTWPTARTSSTAFAKPASSCIRAEFRKGPLFRLCRRQPFVPSAPDLTLFTPTARIQRFGEPAGDNSFREDTHRNALKLYLAAATALRST